MTILVWDQINDRKFESGVDRGVLYPKNAPGVSWSGLTEVTEDLSQSSTALYFDGIKYCDQQDDDETKFTVEAITFPNELIENTIFGLSYRTQYPGGYKIHLIYNATFVTSSVEFATLDDDANPIYFSWDVSTVSIEIPGCKPNAHLIIDSNLADPNLLEFLEGEFYGTSETDPYLPPPSSIIEFLNTNGFAIIDHGDGTWTAIGSTSAIQMLDSTTFQITSSSAVYLDSESYSISST